MEKVNLHEIFQVFKRQGLSKEFDEQSPLLIWHEIAGSQMSRLTKPLRVRDGILYIESANHVVAQQLSLIKDSYIKKINQLLGEERIKDLRFRVGSRGFQKDQKADPGEQPDLLRQEELKSLMENLENPKLKETFEALIAHHLHKDRLRKSGAGKPCAICGLHHDEEGRICYYCELEGRKK